MPVEIVKYRDWVFAVDVDATKSLYNNLEFGDAEGCKCGNCRHFINIRSSVYPDEIQSLLIDLGIDGSKETQLTDFGNNDFEHVYWIGFNFIGKIISGIDCSPLDSSAILTQMSILNKDFEFGFTKRVSTTMVAYTDDLIEIEFWVKTPINNKE